MPELWPGEVEMTWLEKAACKDVDNDGGDRFHPAVSSKEGGRNAKAAYERARTWCRRCTVAVECLQDALAHETYSTRHGIWGGLSPSQRKSIDPHQPLTDVIARALTETPKETSNDVHP